MELNALQHRFLTQLAGRERPALGKDLKPATKPADRDPLIAGGFVVVGKVKRSATFQLTDAGRAWLAANPERPKKAKPAKRPPKPKPVPSFPIPSQRVFMLKLAFTETGQVIEPLKAGQRKPLEVSKWVETTTKGKRLNCELTDAGWKWIEEHLGDTIDGKQTEQVLGAVLGRVGAFLAANNLRLADLLKAKPVAARPDANDEEADGRATVNGVESSTADPASPSAEPPSLTGDLVATIRDACRRLAHNALSPHVKLADLRHALASWDRATIDTKLLELEVAGQVRLVGIGDPRELRPGDREAELRTPGGATRHLLYWTGS